RSLRLPIFPASNTSTLRTDWQQPSSRTGISSFVRGGTGGALPEPYKMTFSRLLVGCGGTGASQHESAPEKSAGIV
ncbi:hypothetical protein PGIGA_G00048600, partial [Pangasianodon gigas]|nr:hypothetical protein [Pangasianodon gigas]